MGASVPTSLSQGFLDGLTETNLIGFIARFQSASYVVEDNPSELDSPFTKNLRISR
jgi:hypothetical protein